MLALTQTEQSTHYLNLDMSRYWSKNTHRLTPYVPGEQPPTGKIIKLNTNENPYPPSPMVLTAIKEACSAELRKYPDPDSLALKQVVADFYALQTNQVFVGNSSDEVLAHTFQALLKHPLPILFPDISYSFYSVYCALYEIGYQQIALRDDFTINLNDYAVANGGIIFANPNAPTGIVLSVESIEKLLRQNTNSVVVVDEAYMDFCKQSALALINQYPNLLIVQTLSKSRSLAGLRVGLAYGHRDLISGLERVKNSFHPYSVNRLAQAGAIAAYVDDTYFKQICSNIISTRNSTCVKLTSLGFDVLPSSTNFLMMKHPKYPAHEMFQALRKYGILVRYFDKPRINAYLRISVGTDKEMARLLAVIASLVSTSD